MQKKIRGKVRTPSDYMVQTPLNILLKTIPLTRRSKKVINDFKWKNKNHVEMN